MQWTVIYHEEVDSDLSSVGPSNARRILKVIEERLQRGEPEKAGKLLRGEFKGLRRIRTGNLRIIYNVDSGSVEVLVVAVGMRRDEEVYALVASRLDAVK
jgi:mRNA interferase RelE/StbE